jgi:hypothetical protein
MTIEGTYVYACPVPDECGGVTITSTPFGPKTTLIETDEYQRLIDLVAEQRKEIEAYKAAIMLMKGYMTEKQLLSLSYMAKLLTEEK